MRAQKNQPEKGRKCNSGRIIFCWTEKENVSCETFGAKNKDGNKPSLK